MNFEIAPKTTEIQADWNDARLYCFVLDINGKSGWRLPTKEELNEIYESENDYEKYWYWSSTEDDDTYAWDQDFTDGFQISTDKTRDVLYVRAVRDLKDN